MWSAAVEIAGLAGAQLKASGLQEVLDSILRGRQCCKLHLNW